MKTGIPSRSLNRSVSGMSRVSSKLKIDALVPVRELTRPPMLKLALTTFPGSSLSARAMNCEMWVQISSNLLCVFSK